MINDDELLLYHYEEDEGNAERQRIAAAIAADSALAARLRRLVAELDAVVPPPVAVPEAAMRRWHADLARAARTTAAAPWRSPRIEWHAGATAAMAMMVVAGIGLGIFFNRERPTDPPIEVMVADAVRYERGLQMHLAQTESQLALLPTLQPEERVAMVERLQVQNRLYIATADRAGEERLARVLRSFAPILDSLADSRTSAAEFEGGLAQLNFELKVMQARLASAVPTPARPVLAL